MKSLIFRDANSQNTHTKKKYRSTQKNTSLRMKKSPKNFKFTSKLTQNLSLAISLKCKLHRIIKNIKKQIKNNMIIMVLKLHNKLQSKKGTGRG